MNTHSVAQPPRGGARSFKASKSVVGPSNSTSTPKKPDDKSPEKEPERPSKVFRPPKSDQ